MAAAAAASAGPAAAAGSRTVEIRFTPAAHLQLALWIERADGTFLATVGLSQSVSYRGIGNRPGAAQMNSGYRWPYGRREGVLPVWAHRRAAVPGAARFKRVVFQGRPEGWASRAMEDSSPDEYFCLTFDEKTNKDDKSTRQVALDAVTCASGFNSDKGRFLDEGDVALGYAEPTEVGGVSVMRALDLFSLYPPRRDAVHCQGGTVCFDKLDVDAYDASARAVMPDLDAVTMATPAPDREQAVQFSVPEDWPIGDYVVFVEASLEGDYNSRFDDRSFPTPSLSGTRWDSWAHDYGYPYRGQPSVVYSVGFRLEGTSTHGEASFSASSPVGYGDTDGFGPKGGDLNPMDDGRITDDSASAPGSGADRLHADPTGAHRVVVDVRNCTEHAAPGVPSQPVAEPDPRAQHSHEWGVLRFVEPASEEPIARYEIRVGHDAIVPGQPDSFMHAPPAVTANLDSSALVVRAGAPGQTVEVQFGGMSPLRHYYVGIRAVDRCGVSGPITVAELDTTKVNFTKLSGCFIATSAYGSALEPRVEALRVVRDALRPRSTVFATATDLYYRSGPVAAALVARSETARALTRLLLGPPVAVAAAVTPLLAR